MDSINKDRLRVIFIVGVGGFFLVEIDYSFIFRQIKF